MAISLYQKLIKAGKQKKLPRINVYNRIDGPGSSLDLRLFQQAFYQLADLPKDLNQDKAMRWSRGYPRTVGITINIGTVIEAEPLKLGKLGVESVDFGFCYVFDKDKIAPTKENWLLRIMSAFNLDGVKFTLRNMNPELKSAGLGGSAAVTTGVAILANALSGNQFSASQIIGMASITEEDLGVSITGTQEQSNVVFGGVIDYIWFPWGIPGKDNFYGTSVRQTLLNSKDYQALRDRIDLYFVLQRQSADVNAKWYEEMRKPSGFSLHRQKCELAYQFRESIRKKQWSSLIVPIKKYREIRTQLCHHYMTDQAWEIERLCQRNGAVSFPLGGGGGTVMVYAPNPKKLEKMRPHLQERFRYVDYNILSKGHKFENLKGF